MKLLTSFFISSLAFAVMTANCIAADAPVQNTVSEPVHLNNDAKYKDALDNLLKNPPATTAAFEDQANYIFNLTTAELRMRDYVTAVSYARQLVKMVPDSWLAHDTLSICLGKSGKYDEAIKEAKQATVLDTPPAMHPNLVLASWEWHAGKKDDALKRVASVAAPSDANDQRNYYGTLTCFYASVGDEEKIQDAFKKASAVDKQGSLVEFLARDIVFDPYRRKDWFINIVGKTLAEPSGK